MHAASATDSSVATHPAMAVLPEVATLPATATLPAVATLPATATLPAVARHLGVRERRHHGALDDAETCAEITLAAGLAA